MRTKITTFVQFAKVLTADGQLHDTSIYRLAETPAEVDEYIKTGGYWYIIEWQGNFGNYTSSQPAPNTCFDAHGKFKYDFWIVSKTEYIYSEGDDTYREKLTTKVLKREHAGNVYEEYLREGDEEEFIKKEGKLSYYGVYYYISTPDGVEHKTVHYEVTRVEGPKAEPLCFTSLFATDLCMERSYHSSKVDLFLEYSYDNKIYKTWNTDEDTHFEHLTFGTDEHPCVYIRTSLNKRNNTIYPWHFCVTVDDDDTSNPIECSGDVMSLI